MTPVDHPVYGMHFGQKYPWSFYFLRVGLAGKPHKGQDFLCPINTPVKAIGRIQQVRVFTDQVPGGTQHPDYGRCIYANSLDHPGVVFVYGHLMAVGIPRIGKIWQAGEVIGWSGNTGKSTSPHLHAEARVNNIQVDPLPYLQ